MASWSEAPLITIVTSTYNVRGFFERTADSVRAQTHSAIQWVVIDGGSTDGTVDEIRRNADIIDHWQSEPDTGIYNAWNKACARIRGDWVLFIGAGDELAGPAVLAEIAPYLTAASDREIVYGKIQLVAETGAVITELGEPWSGMKGKWGGLLPLMPPHPSSFHRQSIFRAAQSFDESFRYAGDSAFVARSVLRADPLYVPIVIDRMLAGGVSNRPGNMVRLARERRRIADSLPVKAPVVHRVAWHIGVASQLAAHTLVPPAVRRAAGRVLRPRSSR